MARFAALDGLRGTSALAVALFHMPVAMHLYGSALVREAYIFVDFFFVLSGFVIAHSYGARLGTAAEMRDFVIRRIGRLWPLHIAVLALYVALEGMRLGLAGGLDPDIRPPFSGETGLITLLPNALLVHVWLPGAPSWNIPSWSISAELFAYLAFALVTLLAPTRRVAVIGGIAALAWIAALLAAGDVDLYYRLGSLRAVSGFFAGVLVYALYRRTGPPRLPLLWATALELAVAGAVLAYLLLVSRIELTPWATPLFAAAILVFAAEGGLLSQGLKSAPLQVLGTLSYSIYLTHGLVVTAFNAGGRLLGRLLHADTMRASTELFAGTQRWREAKLVHLGNFWLNDLYAVFFVGVVIGLSALTYRYIERPGQRLFAGLAPRRAIVPPSTAA